MSTRFVEGNLLFEFDDRWTTLFRWDRRPEYLNGMARSHEGKAVDFIGVLQGRLPFLIEVKDYRHTERADEKGRLEHEMELKVRATVAALFGVRWREPREECVAAFESLHASRRPRLVLWNEEPQPRPAAGGRSRMPLGRSGAAVLRDQLKRNTGWLDADVFVTSSADDYAAILPGVRVCDLSPERRRKAEEVVEILKRRGKTVPPDLTWQIEDVETEAELDELLRRAETVRDAWKLFSDRR